jgi:hypothetical protein
MTKTQLITERQAGGQWVNRMDFLKDRSRSYRRRGGLDRIWQKKLRSAAKQRTT